MTSSSATIPFIRARRHWTRAKRTSGKSANAFGRKVAFRARLATGTFACRLTRSGNVETYARRGGRRFSGRLRLSDQSTEGSAHALHADNQRHGSQRRCRRRHAAALGDSRCARHARHQVRLRPGPLRCLYRASRRRCGALVHHAGFCGRREEDHHHRSRGQDAGRQGSATGLAASRSPAVRLLPVGADHVGCRAAGREQAPDRQGHRRGDGGQRLPLRHLCAHPSGHQAGGAVAAQEGDGMKRRAFLQASLAAGGGLLLGFNLPSARGAQAAAGKSFEPNAFIRIGADGQIVLTMPYVEMGQGTYTSIPMLIAEELEVQLKQVRVEHAPPNEKLYGNPLLGGIQATGNSNAIRASWQPLRQAGATARTMLVSAAAKRWNVDPASCRAQSGEVLHAPTGRRAGYGELAAAAARMPVPENVALKRPQDFKLIGTPAKRLDAPSKVNGTAVYGIDARPPGVKIATLAQWPAFGRRVRSVDDAAAKAVKGVRQIVRLDET